MANSSLQKDQIVGEVETRIRLPRRSVLRGSGGLALAVALRARGSSQVSAQAEPNATTDFTNVELPPDVGQTDLHVYIPETGHTLRGSLLDYWRANGGPFVFGNPVSEPFAAPNGYYSQAFERGVLQYRPEYLWTDEPIMRLMPVRDVMLKETFNRFRRDGRRAEGGGYTRATPWRPLDPSGRVVARVLNGGGRFIEETGHTIRGDFLTWYEAHEGAFYLGLPISEPMKDRGRTIQYFNGGVVESTEGWTGLAPIGREIATRLSVDMTVVPQDGLPTYDESLFLSAIPSSLQGDLSAPGRRWIEVDITQQSLMAYQGNTLILSTLVSTGIPPNDTERGLFHVRLKYPKQDMQGFTDGTGEVIGFGADAPAGAQSYEVKDVPNVMYINLDAEALHGAYWHNNFGTPMSHGCINLPLDVAAFLYEWAPLGTMVWSHD